MQLRNGTGFAAALFILLTPALSSAVVIRADRSDSQYLNLAANTAYASVGRFDGATSSFGFLASGTLIAPDWVLTAGHVVDQATSLSFTIGGSSYAADKLVANPGWTGDLMAGYDIALVHLSKTVTGVPAAQRYTGTKERGATATMVGYGMTGNGVTGATSLDGNKRAANNVIDVFQNSRLMLADFDSPTNRRENKMGSANPLNLEGMIAPGDSGGGLFINVGGKNYLAGVTSFAGAYDGKVDSDYGDIGGWTRVSSFNSWIDSVMTGYSAVVGPSAITSDSGQVLATVSPIPEPSSIALLLSAMGGVWLLRRKLR